ncbi:MAG TPA: hypothetical protein VK196_17100 [Magnetospirillum sp.]|nr:hypothetical protein [Magnetospirillum sp.]
MSEDPCRSCAHMKRDDEWRLRCYSPQLQRQRLAGILCLFERDTHPEPAREAARGTGKCGPAAANHVERIGL